MASPFTIFRKHQKVMIATLGLLAMIAFVFLPMFLDSRSQNGPGKDSVVVTSKYGDLTENQLGYLMSRREAVINFLLRAIKISGFDQQTTMGRQMAIEEFFGHAGEESTVNNWLLVQRAKSMGMSLSDNAVSDFITADVTDNRVTNEQFANLYKSMNIDENIVFDTLQDELLAMELTNVFKASLGGAPPAQRWEYFQRLNRQVELQVATVPVSSYVHEIEDPGDEVLEEYFEEHKGDLPNPTTPEPGFRVPSKAMVEYVKADMSNLANIAAPTDKEIEEYYKKHREAKFLKLPGLDEGEKKPAEKKTPEAKPAEKPAEKPAGEKPAEKPAAPKKDSPEKDAPKKDAAKPDAKKSSAVGSGSPFRLVSMAEEKKADEKKPAEKKEAEKKADKKTAAEKKPAEKKPAEKKPAEKPVEKKTDPKAAAESEAKKPATDPKYRTLDEVRNEIIAALVEEKNRAAIKAFDDVDKSFQPIKDAVNKYRRELSLYKANIDQEDTKKPTPPDFDAMAKKAGFTFHKTGLVSAAEMGTLDIGRSMLEDGRSFIKTIFSSSALHRPADAHDMKLNKYLYWKTDSSEEEVPKFEDEGVREKVLQAWKLGKAREIAIKEAEKLAEEARKSEKPLSESIGGKRSVEKTGPFTWLVRANVPGAQGRMQLMMGRVKGVERPGDKFMRKVYDLGVGETGVALNQPENMVYVVQLEKTEPSDTDLWKDFKVDNYEAYAAAGGSDRARIFKAWFDGISEEANLKWERKPVPPVRRRQR